VGGCEAAAYTVVRWAVPERCAARRGALRLAAIAAALTLASAAVAEAPDVLEERARKHYEAGRALYDLGNFPDAVAQWTAGYKLSPKTGFLLNLGQAYRKMGDLARAHEYFEEFLARAPLDDPARPRIATLDEEVRRRMAEVTVDGGAPRDGGVEAKPAPPAMAVRAPPPEKPAPRRWRWWLVGIAAVIVAAGAAVGIALGLEANRNWCSGDRVLGCVGPN
jgi:tetratricopeptide (TPR) repeat protein